MRTKSQQKRLRKRKWDGSRRVWCPESQQYKHLQVQLVIVYVKSHGEVKYNEYRSQIKENRLHPYLIPLGHPMTTGKKIKQNVKQ